RAFRGGDGAGARAAGEVAGGVRGSGSLAGPCARAAVRDRRPEDREGPRRTEEAGRPRPRSGTAPLISLPGARPASAEQRRSDARRIVRGQKVTARDEVERRVEGRGERLRHRVYREKGILGA